MYVGVLILGGRGLSLVGTRLKLLLLDGRGGGGGSDVHTVDTAL